MIGRRGQPRVAVRPVCADTETMRLRQLQSFVAVCELGSITRAAEKLYIAQPALGVQIRGLEDEVGAQLLERSARGVVVTPAGRLALVWAQEILRSTASLKEELRELTTSLSGRLTLGLTPSVAALFAMPVLLAVQDALPKVQLQLVENVGHELTEWVLAGQVDLALVFDARDAMPLGSSPILQDQLYFVSAFGAGAANRDSIDFEEVLEQPLVLPAAVDSIRKIAESAARALNVPLPLKYEVRSPGVIVSLVRQGFANSIMPLPVIVDAVAQGQLSACRIVSPTLDRYLYWVRGASSGAGQPTKEFERLVAHTIRQETVNSPWAAAYRLLEHLCLDH